MKSTLLCLILLMGGMVAWGQSPLSPEQRQRLDALVAQDVPPGAPGLATAVLRDGQLVYQRCLGYADLTDSLRIGPDTRFNYCSNAKQFAALAVLRLADEGNLRLDQDLRDFFPALYPALATPLTLRHLLTHRSGIRDCYDLLSLQGQTWWQHAYTNADVMAWLHQQRDLNFAPGSQYRYSNSNYVLLAEVVAQVSGQPFTAYTQALFQRLGMPSTAFVGPDAPLPAQVARPYFNFDTWTTYDWPWQVNGDGNLFTTLRDQLTWEGYLQAPATAPLPALLIRQSQQLTDLPGATDYGYGLEFGRYVGRPYRFHEGSTGSWKATLLRFPTEKLSLITLVNTGKTSSDYLSRALADVMLGITAASKAHPQAPDSVGPTVATEDLPGVYLGEGTFHFRIEATEQPDEWLLKRPGRNDTRLLRASGHVFHQWNDSGFQLAFRRNDSGEMTLTAYHVSHAPYTLTRVEADWSDFDPLSWEGQYVNAETGVSLNLRHTQARGYEVLRGEQASQGLLIAPDRMLVDGYLLRREGSDLLLRGARIDRVRFDRQR